MEVEGFERELEQSLLDAFKDKVKDVIIRRKRRMFFGTDRENVKDILRFLKRTHGLEYISAITALDIGEEIELLYHLVLKDPQLFKDVVASLRTTLPKDEPRIPTITDLFPGAVMFEREVQDLMGVRFEGIPDSRRLLLPDDWPEGVYPLRKDFKPEEVK